MHQGPDGSLHAVAKDITERHEQQALATRRDEQLNDAQRLAQMGSWETDFASGLHTLSESLREMLACDSSSITDEWSSSPGCTRRTATGCGRSWRPAPMKT